MTESFELFKLRNLLAHLTGEEAQVVQDAISHIKSLEQQHARDSELWNSLSIAVPKGNAP